MSGQTKEVSSLRSADSGTTADEVEVKCVEKEKETERPSKVVVRSAAATRTPTSWCPWDSGSSHGTYACPAYTKGAVGFKNEGNTCYFNSMLQTVLNAGPFVKPLLDSFDKCERWTSGDCARALFQVLTAVHRSESHSALSTWQLRRSLSARDSMFTDRRQHDSWLALSHLLSQLESEWFAENPSMPCSIGLHFERPFSIPVSVSNEEFAKYNLEKLVAKKVLAAPTACFYGVDRDSVQCHGCGKSTTTYSVTRVLDVSWNTVSCIARVIGVRNGVVDGVLVCDAAKGLTEDSAVSSLCDALMESPRASSTHRPLLLSVSFNKSLKVKRILPNERLRDLSLPTQCLVAVRSDHAHYYEGVTANTRSVFSVVVGTRGDAQCIEGLRDFALIPDSALLSRRRHIHAVCAEAIGLDECKTIDARSYDLYVTCGEAVVYDWNKDVLRFSALPLILVLWPRAHLLDSAVGRKWKAPHFCPKRTAFESETSAISAAFAAAKQQCPELNVAKAIAKWNRCIPYRIPVECGSEELDCDKYDGKKFCRNAAAAINKKWKLSSAAPLLKSEMTLPSKGRLTLAQCVEDSERTVECSWRESRCRNPECDKRTTSFTRITALVLPPPVLAVHLNRDTAGTGQKDNRQVECPLFFDFKGFLYKMAAASVHGGYSLHYGHYTAKVRNVHSGKWFYANDSSISNMCEPKGIDDATLVVYVCVEGTEAVVSEDHSAEDCEMAAVRDSVTTIDTDGDFDMFADKHESEKVPATTVGKGAFVTATVGTYAKSEAELLESATKDTPDDELDAADKSSSLLGSASPKLTDALATARDEVANGNTNDGDTMTADKRDDVVGKKLVADAKEDDIVGKGDTCVADLSETSEDHKTDSKVKQEIPDSGTVDATVGKAEAQPTSLRAEDYYVQEDTKFDPVDSGFISLL